MKRQQNRFAYFIGVIVAGQMSSAASAITEADSVQKKWADGPHYSKFESQVSGVLEDKNGNFISPSNENYKIKGVAVSYREGDEAYTLFLNTHYSYYSVGSNRHGQILLEQSKSVEKKSNEEGLSLVDIWTKKITADKQEGGPKIYIFENQYRSQKIDENTKSVELVLKPENDPALGFIKHIITTVYKDSANYQSSSFAQGKIPLKNGGYVISMRTTRTHQGISEKEYLRKLRSSLRSRFSGFLEESKIVQTKRESWQQCLAENSPLTCGEQEKNFQNAKEKRDLNWLALVKASDAPSSHIAGQSYYPPEPPIPQKGGSSSEPQPMPSLPDNDDNIFPGQKCWKGMCHCMGKIIHHLQDC